MKSLKRVTLLLIAATLVVACDPFGDEMHSGYRPNYDNQNIKDTPHDNTPEASTESDIVVL